MEFKRVLLIIACVGSIQLANAQDAKELKLEVKEASKELQERGDDDLKLKQEKAIEMKEARKAEKEVKKVLHKSEREVMEKSEAKEEVEKAKSRMNGHAQEADVDKREMTKKELIQVHQSRIEKVAERKSQMAARLDKAEMIMKERMSNGEIDQEEFNAKMTRINAARDRMRAIEEKVKENATQYEKALN